MRVRLCTEGHISEPVGQIAPDVCFMIEDNVGAITSEHAREACIGAGFTAAELDAAEADPGEWIDCPREEAGSASTTDYYEYWSATAVGREPNQIVEDAQGTVLFALNWLGVDRNLEIANRIVTCVNACAGITDVAIESLREQNARLTRERDALLAVCRKFTWGDILDLAIWDEIQAAIALAKPKTPC